MMEQSLELTDAFHQLDQQLETVETELGIGEKGIGDGLSMDFVEDLNVKNQPGMSSLVPPL